jgi:hypothetical protein
MGIAVRSERGAGWAVRLALLVGVVLAVVTLGSPVLTGSSARPGLSARARVLSLDALSAMSARIGATDREFAARRVRGGYAMGGGGVSAVLGRSGARLTGRGAVSMVLAGVGRGDRVGDVGGAAVSARGDRVAYDYRGVTAWYAAGPLGVEQGFTVVRRPDGGRADAPLTLSLDLSGSLSARRTRSGVEFVTRSGRLGLSYGGLAAVDATGRKLPARFVLRHGRLLVRVRERGARYPIRIDPLFQLGSKLTGGDAATGYFGNAVAVSGDGNTALVTQPGATSDAGAAWVFVRSGSTWTEQAKLTASDESGTTSAFGFSAALSDDGDTAVIGGEMDDSGVGAAWVFARSGSTWTQQAKLTEGMAEKGDGEFGFSVAVSSAGTTVLVGSALDNADIGSAWVFNLSGSTWQQPGVELAPNDETDTSHFGGSVALSGAGTTALVGGDQDNDGAGAAWVYTLSGSTWTQGPKLTGGQATATANFGCWVALSADASTALIGGLGNDTNDGAAWVFTNSGSAWSQQAELIPKDESGAAGFGVRLGLSADGDTALIGGYTDGTGTAAGTGAAWLFTRSGSTWTQEGSKLLAGGETGAGAFGFSASLSWDGNTALIGAPDDNGDAGAAWIFENEPPTCAGTSAATAVGGGTVTLALQCSDLFGLPLTYAIVAGPAHGALGPINQSTGAVSYTPDPGYSGTDQFTYDATGADGASNVATAAIVIPGVARPTPRLNPTIGYTVHVSRRYTIFDALYLSGVPSAASVDVSCRGHGCPSKSHVERVPARRVCKGKGKRRHCVKKPPPRVGTVTLTSLFRRRHLAVGAKVTIRVVETGAIGRVYVLAIRRSRAPSDKVSCLAPGSTTPGRGC